MTNINALIAANEIVIVSGEGEGFGHVAAYAGERTIDAIKACIAKESCNGDRWASAKVFSHVNNDGEKIYVDIESGEFELSSYFQ